MPFLKKRKEKRKYVARPGIEPRTPDLRVRCPTDCATRPGASRVKISQSAPETDKFYVSVYQGFTQRRHFLSLQVTAIFRTN